MNKMPALQLYIVYATSALYMGYGEHLLVWAPSKKEILQSDKVNGYFNDFFYEQDGEQYLEETGNDSNSHWHNIDSITLLSDEDPDVQIAFLADLVPITLDN